MKKYHVTATINGDEVDFLCEPTQSLLDVLRLGDHTVTPDHFELLFESADALERAIDLSVSGHEAEVDVSRLLSRLDQATDALGPPPKRKSRPSTSHTSRRRPQRTRR